MKYFSIEELCRSLKAKQLGISNIPNEEHELNLIKLVDNILDPLREAWGKPIRVNSGYRGVELNKEVGGSKTSLHCTGLAADISVGNSEDNKKLFNLAQELNLPYDLLIDEYNYSWVHISYSPRNRKLILHIT